MSIGFIGASCACYYSLSRACLTHGVGQVNDTLGISADRPLKRQNQALMTHPAAAAMLDAPQFWGNAAHSPATISTQFWCTRAGVPE
jgi:hypothetical protein